MPSRRRTSSKLPLTPRRQFMQVAVTFVLPAACIGALGSLLKIEHPLLALALSPLALAGWVAIGFALRVAARAAAAASTRPLPRWLYALGGLCFLALTVLLAGLSYTESHASGNAGVSIAVAFLACYSAIAGVLALGRALARGAKRLAFWVFPPRWLESELLADRKGART